jgi:hypothetical protein
MVISPPPPTPNDSIRGRRLQGAQEAGRPHEIELVHAAHREGDQEQREQRHLLDLGERLEGRELLLAGLRRRFRQREAPPAQDEAQNGAELEGIAHPLGLRLQHLGRRNPRRRMHHPQPVADADAHRDPAERPPDADLSEIAVPIRQMRERERVAQTERRHIDQGVEDAEDHQPAVALDLGQLPDKQTTHDVADA